MSLITTILQKLGLTNPYSGSIVDEALDENLKHDASVVAALAQKATESAGRMMEASSKLRSSIQNANVKSFADFEHLVHHGERRRARH